MCGKHHDHDACVLAEGVNCRRFPAGKQLVEADAVDTARWLKSKGMLEP
jgi:hypothetical protein